MKNRDNTFVAFLRISTLKYAFTLIHHLCTMDFYCLRKNNFHRPLFVLLALILCLSVWGQESNDELEELAYFNQSVQYFSENIPREKVYLHFDNTSYYQGDNIWFKCYVVTPDSSLFELSKTLYVELLNPGGETIEKRILKIENGQCHGDFALNRSPFYSGFYEVRAYTKYMLNFGEDVIFSRLLPVFNRPKTEGDYENREMVKYGNSGPAGGYLMKREKPEKGKTVNIRFFPEGGNLIQGLPSRIAFEATDEAGNPIEVRGAVRNNEKQEIAQLATTHEGRGVFTYTPVAGNQKARVEVEYSGKEYRFDLPAALQEGIVMDVDNLSHADSIGITLRKSENTPAGMLGLTVLTGGVIQSYSYIKFTGNKQEIRFRIDKTQFPLGVSQVVLFNAKGEILCDRLVFTGRNDDRLDIQVKTDKPSYEPYEPVDMEISIADGKANPVQTPFSLSVRDGDGEVEYRHNILTDLLLMSEIKGYVRDPAWYFEEEDDARRQALDVLLMVQGWRSHSWKQMTGSEPFELKYIPEQGIETSGKIVSFVKKVPKPGVKVDMLLQQRGEEEEEAGVFAESFVSDEQGHFSFVSDVEGKWNMILSVSEKGKQKDHRILMDNLFSPEPKKYRYADMQVTIADNTLNVTSEETEEETEREAEEDFESLFALSSDSLIKVHRLDEVVITANKNSRGSDIRQSRSTSVAYYDVATEYDDIYDKGKYVGDDIHEFLKNMNPEFYFMSSKPNAYLIYKGKTALVVVDYERVDIALGKSFFRYKDLKIPAIKSIYINENQSVIRKYMYYTRPVKYDFSCVVFIETWPDGRVPMESIKGVRKTGLEGYSSVSEFYSPNYSELPPLPDYRRTLYWNPSVTTDENGMAKIQFYNNSSCRNFSISAETVTSQGMVGYYKNK